MDETREHSTEASELHGDAADQRASADATELHGDSTAERASAEAKPELHGDSPPAQPTAASEDADAESAFPLKD